MSARPTLSQGKKVLSESRFHLLACGGGPSRGGLKRSAVVELFLGDMGSIQRELRPSIQREDQLTMETKLEQIAVKAVNQLPKSVVRYVALEFMWRPTPPSVCCSWKPFANAHIINWL